MSHAEMTIDARDEGEDLQLMSAALDGQTETVKALLRHGVDVNAQSDAGFAPLILAACSGDARIAQVLLNSGADVKKTLKSGQTALAHAAEHGYNDIVELLKRTMSRSKDVKSQTVLESGSLKSVLTLS